MSTDKESAWLVSSGRCWSSRVASSTAPYGNLIAEQGTGETPRFGFAGQELDVESGLYHYDHRYYDPVNDRFTSQDSTGVAQRSRSSANGSSWTRPASERLNGRR
jgi:RHS repeat-associated protein